MRSGTTEMVRTCAYQNQCTEGVCTKGVCVRKAPREVAEPRPAIAAAAGRAAEGGHTLSAPQQANPGAQPAKQRF